MTPDQNRCQRSHPKSRTAKRASAPIHVLIVAQLSQVAEQLLSGLIPRLRDVENQRVRNISWAVKPSGSLAIIVGCAVRQIQKLMLEKHANSATASPNFLHVPVELGNCPFEVQANKRRTDPPRLQLLIVVRLVPQVYAIPILKRILQTQTGKSGNTFAMATCSGVLNPMLAAEEKYQAPFAKLSRLERLLSREVLMRQRLPRRIRGLRHGVDVRFSFGGHRTTT